MRGSPHHYLVKRRFHLLELLLIARCQPKRRNMARRVRGGWYVKANTLSWYAIKFKLNSEAVIAQAIERGWSVKELDEGYLIKVRKKRLRVVC